MRVQFLAKLGEGLERAKVGVSTRLLVAISGGADSTALLLGLHKLSSGPKPSIEIQAAHFNHYLRGEDSNADERFCQDLCNRLQIKLHIGSGDVAKHAAVGGGSVETAAREMRYLFLASTSYENDFDAVVTGHTMDDQAETVLLAMTRGSGLRGLSGMSYTSDRLDLAINSKPLRVIRPMLGLRRSDTEQFCDANSVTSQDDESNDDTAYARNRVRHNVIPELQKINPGVIDAISRLAAITSDDSQLIDALAKKALSEAAVDAVGGLSKQALRDMAPALRTHVLAAAYLTAVGSVRDLDSVSLLSASDAVTRLDSGSIDLPNDAKLVIEHGTVRFLVGETDPGCPYPDAVDNHVLHLSKSIRFQDGGTLSAHIVRPAPHPASLTRWQAIINPEVIKDRRLQVRARQDGDRFHPLGMEGEMKLQDFFVNQHIPARWRDRVPLVLTDRGICWVAGERVAEWAKMPDGASEAVLLEYVARAQTSAP